MRDAEGSGDGAGGRPRGPCALSRQFSASVEWEVGQETGPAVSEFWVLPEPPFSSGVFEPGLLPHSIPRRPQPHVSQQRGRLCSLGTCQTHRLPEIIYWLRSASTKEPSGKAGSKPQDPHSYGRRRRREARAPLRLQDPSLRQGQSSTQLAG